MIRVKRGSSPAELVGDNSVGGRERQKVIDFYAIKKNREASFNYAAYKAKAIIAALGTTFNGKCAYCESPYVATQPVDVEHFRPKGGVADQDENKKFKLLKLGYYWLAATWANLYPSCIDCNRERSQEITNADPAKVGKANKFPLAKGSKRASKPGQEAKEKPLLLDPCEVDPERFFEYTKEGVVRARPKLDAKDKLRVSVSIETYGLQRSGLVQVRRDRAQEILAQIKRVKVWEELYAQSPSSEVVKSQLAFEMSVLKDHTAEHRPYAGMARDLINARYQPGKS